MRPCFHVEIETPKKVLLNGLWFGPKKPKRAIIVVHGLAGSLFSLQGVVEKLIDTETAVLTFNNRGFAQVASVKQRVGKTARYIAAGTAHEIFADSVDDIDGAVLFARRMGVKDIFLAGHSTGANKVVYWLSKKKGARGAILLGPLSDYSGMLATKGPAHLKKATAYARRLVAAGKPHDLMPEKFTEWFACDAQRFLSLYTPESKEEMFSYARPQTVPRTLKKVRAPLLIALSGADEYADRSIEEIRAWFLQHMYEGEPIVIPGVDHSFKGGERALAKEIKSWMARV